MENVVTYDLDRGVAVLTLDNPPVNALGYALRAGLLAAVQRAGSDPGARAILIRAAGHSFPAGADIREFGRPPRDPWLPELCNCIEAAQKPVVAALHGTALGGGFELALAAHYRVAAPDARIGFPEVTLGILPGAGGTQRAPRLCGARAALDLMLSGRPIGAAEALKLGLIDVIAGADLFTASIDLALEMARQGAPLRPTRARREGFADPVAYENAIRERRTALQNNPVPAPARIIDCIEAALLLPFDEGMTFEGAAFQDLVKSPESVALRHAFFAERMAAKQPDLKNVPARQIARIGVVGGGLMAAGIAVNLLDAGLPVVMIEHDVDSLRAGIERVETIYAREAAKGRLSEEQAGARLARFTGSLDYTALGSVDLVIEAVVEDMAVKQAVFSALDTVLKAGAIIATSTSYLNINTLQAGVSRPSDVIGLHFFSPANIMKLLEIVVTDAIAPNVVATMFQLAKRLGKIPVRAGVCDGFIGNRIFSAYRDTVDSMVEDGASPYEIDAAMRAYGFRLGPYQVLDIAGLDSAWTQRRCLASERDTAARYVEIADRMRAVGWLGQKTGRGYYRYAPGEALGHADPEVLALINEVRAQKRIVSRTFSTREIQARCLAAMANEGARLFEEGIAVRPGDIDTVMIHGFGFPRWRGGPMMAADLAGLLAVENNLKRFAAEAPKFWKPAPLFSELIKTGRGFATLNTV